VKTFPTWLKLSACFSQAISHQKAPIGRALAFASCNRIASGEKGDLFNFAHFSVIFQVI
jgi:hypothetical protein